MDYFDELHDNIKNSQQEMCKVNEKEFLSGSYMDTVSKVNRYTTEVKTAVEAARKSLEDIKGLGAYKTSKSIQDMFDTVDKSLQSIDNISSHALSTLKKLGA